MEQWKESASFMIQKENIPENIFLSIINLYLEEQLIQVKKI